MRFNGPIGYLGGAMMGVAYSVDLRRKVVQACERSMRHKQKWPGSLA
jgi:hypothetical protein